MSQNKPKRGIRRVGLLGGTFDPIHYGHLISAQWSMERFSLDQVLFIPTGSPPHKQENEVMPATHRYQMVLLAIKDHPNFKISTIELTREGPSYTIDTIRTLQNRYNGNAQLFFITGADSILELHTWHRYKELLASSNFIATTREGYDSGTFHKRVAEFQEKYSARILELEIPAIGISSSRIRDYISKGISIKYLVPERVEQYIIKNNLYTVGV